MFLSVGKVNVTPQILQVRWLKMISQSFTSRTRCLGSSGQFLCLSVSSADRVVKRISPFCRNVVVTDHLLSNFEHRPTVENGARRLLYVGALLLFLSSSELSSLLL
ncbi:unnamed protein product, partial [Ectocarpus sp. 13 AM-2016]